MFFSPFTLLIGLVLFQKLSLLFPYFVLHFLIQVFAPYPFDTIYLVHFKQQLLSHLDQLIPELLKL